MTETTADDDRLFAFYNQELIALASQVDAPHRLQFPSMSAHAVSPICGSEIDIDILVDDAGLITAIGYEVEACALTKSVVAVLRQAAIGKTRAEVAAAGKDLESMLSGESVRPSGDWARLAILEPVKDYKARHNSILLPFEAVERAFRNNLNF